MTSPINEDLTAALSLETLADGRFAAHVPDGWQQGRGAFGGLVLGLLAKAMEGFEPEPERLLRTFAGEIAAPVIVGDAEIAVELLRRGSGVSSLSARLRQQGEVRAHATALFGKTRSTDRDHLGITPPALPDWREVEVLPVGPPFGPDFARAFEYRVSGPMPFSGGTEPRAEGFVRAHRPPPRLGTPEIVALIDAYWPTTFAIESMPRPMATVSFTFQRCLDPALLDPALPLFHRAKTLASADGYMTELRELWTTDGRLVALNPQTFAIIK